MECLLTAKTPYLANKYLSTQQSLCVDPLLLRLFFLSTFFRKFRCTVFTEKLITNEVVEFLLQTSFKVLITHNNNNNIIIIYITCIDCDVLLTENTSSPSLWSFLMTYSIVHEMNFIIIKKKTISTRLYLFSIFFITFYIQFG